MSRLVGLLLFCLTLGCSQGSDELYARERAMPAWCRVPVTELEARRLLTDALPTVPYRLEILTTASHQTRRDRVTGQYVITLSTLAMTSQAVAHEAAHVVLFDAYRPSTPFEQPPQQPPLHGDIFIAQYKRFLRQMVSAECADAL